MSARLRRHHDMGGLEAGPVERQEHDHAPWEKKVDTIVRLLRAKGLISFDELRRHIEDLGPGVYDEMSYYERWIAAASSNLLEKQVIGVDELGEAISRAHDRHAAPRP